MKQITKDFSPPKPKEFIIKSGQRCRLSGVRREGENEWIASLFVFDLNKFIEVDFNKIEKYL